MKNKEEGESTISYVTRLRKLFETCEYDKSEEQVRDQYVCSCQSGKLHEKLLRIPNLDLTKFMKVGQIYEQSKHQADEINAAEYQQEVNYQHVRKPKTTKSRGKAKVCFNPIVPEGLNDLKNV